MEDPRYLRVQGIDGFRGLAIVLMALGNFSFNIRWVPGALKHMPDIGVTIADLVAPMFIFAIALTVGPSMQRRRIKFGKRAAQGKMALRSLALIGIGAIVTAGEAMNPSPGRILSWGVLQCIGASSLILLLFIYSPAWLRALTGLILLALYQFLLDSYFLEVVKASSHNGLLGTLSWSGMLMIATVIVDRFYLIKSFKWQTIWLAASGIAAAGFGLLLSIWVPLAKSRASASYMAVSLGFCLLVFAVFHWFLDAKPGRLPWLQKIGRNPLALYIAHLLILGLVVSPGQDGWYAGAPIWLSLLQAAAIFAALFGIATFLEKKGWILRL